MDISPIRYRQLKFKGRLGNRSGHVYKILGIDKNIVKKCIFSEKVNVKDKNRNGGPTALSVEAKGKIRTFIENSQEQPGEQWGSDWTHP